MKACQINQLIARQGFSRIGIRVMTGGVTVAPGDEIANSFVWNEGICTDEQLSGASNLDLHLDLWDEISEDRLAKMYEQSKDYDHENQVVVVGTRSYDCYEGNDPNETVMPDAVCVAVLVGEIPGESES